MSLGTKFRTHVFFCKMPTDGQARRWGGPLGAASVATPLMLGSWLGAAANGQVIADPGDFVGPQATPFPFAVGVMCLCQFAFLAPTYLVVEANNAL